jgi:hypothetical protein
MQLPKYTIPVPEKVVPSTSLTIVVSYALQLFPVDTIVGYCAGGDFVGHLFFMWCDNRGLHLSVLL